MEIIRAALDDTHIFSEEKLNYGACCFYTEDKTCRYFFEINGQEAILYADERRYIDKAIDEFLFYSNFISCIKDPNGQILKQRNAGKLELLGIINIQPSQFFINERKLANCKLWIKNQRDIMIPITVINGKAVSLDGHTRLRAALDLGYKYIYTYQDDCDKYIVSFVNEAIRRNILNVTDMEILSDDEYRLKWHKFCDDFFLKLLNHLTDADDNIIEVVGNYTPAEGEFDE